MVDPAAAALAVDIGDGAAWAQVAMCLGDTGQPALCFVVCLFARRLGQPDEIDGRLSAHMALASMDLGGVEPDRIDAWLASQLSETDSPRFVCERLLARLSEPSLRDPPG